MNAMEKRDRLIEMTFEWLRSQGFIRRSRYLIASTPIVLVFVKARRYKRAMPSSAEFFIDVFMTPLSEHCKAIYGVKSLTTEPRMAAHTSLQACNGRTRTMPIEIYEVYADEVTAEEYFTLKMEPDLRSLLRFMEETDTFEKLMSIFLEPVTRFHSGRENSDMDALCILRDLDPVRFRARFHELLAKDPWYLTLFRKTPGFLTPDLLPDIASLGLKIGDS